MLKRLIKDAFGKLGYEKRKKGGSRYFNLYNPVYLSKICHPQTVIDVGVGCGTYPLYEAFPTSYFVLVEPLEEYKSSINEILSKYKGEVHYKAVGNEKGIIEINVDTVDLSLSTHFDRTKLTESGNRLEKRKVEITTLDEILNQHDSLERPLVLKVDTEGNDLNVLKGASVLLESTDFVIAEVSIATRFENSYEFEDLVTFMSANGFSLFSFLFIAHLAKEIRPRYADVVFVRRNRQT